MFRISKNGLVISELNDSGIQLFDKYLHPEENHFQMKVDLKWLEKELSLYGTVKKEKRKAFNNYYVKKDITHLQFH